jgi:hypothetical protein
MQRKMFSLLFVFSCSVEAAQALFGQGAQLRIIIKSRTINFRDWQMSTFNLP